MAMTLPLDVRVVPRPRRRPRRGRTAALAPRRSWRSLTREEKQLRLAELRRGQQAAVASEIRQLDSLR